MKTKVIITVILSSILSHCFCFSHNIKLTSQCTHNTGKDSITIDSVALANNNFSNLLTRFIRQNIDSIDTDSYLSILICDFDTIKKKFIVVITVLNDLENELHMTKEGVSGFLLINNRLVLIKDIGGSENILFSRSGKRRVFTYIKREILVLGRGKLSTHAAYSVKFSNKTIVKIRRIFYVRHPMSRINKILHRLRYRELSI